MKLIKKKTIDGCYSCKMAFQASVYIYIYIFNL